MSHGNLWMNFYRGDSVRLIINGVECKVTLDRIMGRQAKMLIQAPKEHVRIERDQVSKQHFKPDPEGNA